MLRFIGIIFAVVVMSKPTAAAELIMLEQAACHYCERWHEEIGVVYHKTAEGKRAPLRRIDIHESLPTDLADLKTGRYTPTFVLYDNNREVGRLRGYAGEDFFWGLLGELLEKLPNPTEKSG